MIFEARKRVAAMNEVNLRAEPRQVERLFAGGIAAANHDQRLIAEDRQRAVARRAVGHAFGFQQVFAWNAEMLDGLRRWR